MYTSKILQLLEDGRLVVRMHIGSNTALYAGIDLYCLVKTPAGIDTVTRLVHCHLTVTSARVDPLRFRVISERRAGTPHTLPEDWRMKVASKWPYYWADGQIACAVVQEETDNVSVPPASIQALPHYARCIDQLNQFIADADEASLEIEYARHIVLKLKSIYEQLVKTWGNCITLV